MPALKSFMLKLRDVQARPYLLRYLPITLLLMALVALAYSVSEFMAWTHAKQLNRAYQQQSIDKLASPASSPLHAYTLAYLQSFKVSNRKEVDHVISLFSQAETTSDIDLRARAKFASGNVYYDLAIQSTKIAEGGAHQQAVAQIELARESYKEALRLRPNLEAAKFNLELLDRLSPEKRTQGWLAETDGVTLQPFKRNGTAMMKDNTRRGLP